MRDKVKRAWWLVQDIAAPIITGYRAAWERAKAHFSENGLVPRRARCPQCKERHEDKLVWDYDGVTIECLTCGAYFEIWDGEAFVVGQV